AQKTSITTPVPRSVPLLKQTPDPIAMQQTVQPKLSVNEQRVVVMDNNSWEVQIGSYLAHERAQAQAQAATRWIPGAVVITEVEISNRKLYRARLVGLQENQARTACQHLTRQGMECLVVRSQG
ncbi:MAG: SPOR domain-containing protein, partial [Pseudomonadota bacterium]